MSSSTEYLEPYGGEESQLRGFALYVGMSETKARESGVELGDIVSTLRDALSRRIPLVECEALAVIAPLDEKAGDLEVVMLASGQPFVSTGAVSSAASPGTSAVSGGLADSGALAVSGGLAVSGASADSGASAASAVSGEDADVVIDLARHRVLVDDRDLRLTFKEFALLQLFVDHAGRTISRTHLRNVTATSDGADVNDRTIDVRIRRLRIKLGEYPDLIRTVPGRGYRFDLRPDVVVVAG